MPSFQRLLVATDFSAASHAAFRAALDTCAALHASLVLLHVFEETHSEVAVEQAGDATPEGETQSLHERCQDSLRELQEQALRAGVVCETILTRGGVAATILQTISARKIDLAILGTSALHGLDRIVFDSTTEVVLREATCPVLTVGPRALNPESTLQSVEPVVFATDFHLTTIHAIRFAACFSHQTKSPLHCLHVMPRALEDCTQCQVVPAIISEALQQLADESGVVVEAPICATTYGSEVSYAVVDYAKQQKAKLIVIGVRQESLEASRIPLHIAYRILTEAPCPVLTMTFASPPDVPTATTRRRVSAVI
jgi:nucleotide-binding universal stress UspA family protein